MLIPLSWLSLIFIYNLWIHRYFFVESGRVVSRAHYWEIENGERINHRFYLGIETEHKLFRYIEFEVSVEEFSSLDSIVFIADIHPKPFH